MSTHTPTPWRIGDAGYTVFGPPNGNPSPVTVATVKDKANATFIVHACNSHDALLSALRGLESDMRSLSEQSDSNALDLLNRLRRGHCPAYEAARAAIALAEKGAES